MNRQADHSFAPHWLRVVVSVVAAMFLLPFVLVLVVPWLCAIPMAAPFVFSVFAGDVAAERRAVRATLRAMERAHPRPFWYTPAGPVHARRAA